jgi:hypothetical protein
LLFLPDELCHPLDDESLGLLEEDEDEPISLDPPVRPDELPSPSDWPILLPNCELSLSFRETSLFTFPAEVEPILSLLILSRLRLSIQPPFRLVVPGVNAGPNIDSAIGTPNSYLWLVVGCRYRTPDA